MSLTKSLKEKTGNTQCLNDKKQALGKYLFRRGCHYKKGSTPGTTQPLKIGMLRVGLEILKNGHVHIEENILQTLIIGHLKLHKSKPRTLNCIWKQIGNPLTSTRYGHYIYICYKKSKASMPCLSNGYYL